ncbi:hypothetical protein ADIS_1128 [Lunatimonas lonarensis]|uniref:Uncharacterized protein n=1 Tax=Lunatimonas lonarensis TaxID=1232681 RepID=R7ZVT7_9BACT|nr:hypothetical protein ADIS_1128 [Lunatimonas lonarensis]
MTKAVDSAPLALGWRFLIPPWALPKAIDVAPLVLIVN